MLIQQGWFCSTLFSANQLSFPVVLRKKRVDSLEFYKYDVKDEEERIDRLIESYDE
jgi:hypothetical protein